MPLTEALCSVFLIRYYSGDKIRNNEMDEAYSMHGREEMHAGFWRKTLRDGDLLEDPGEDGRIILKWIFE
jgi:hypothetical protein